MAYQVLARKWRPRNFPEMVGQAHVLRALTHALENNRLHHAYLFTGTRGVGKTTIARILAKSLNCESGVTAYPCGQCPACREIDDGRFVDLIEVDAASRTKVEDTRDLLENVQYAPTRGRYKVYLIDEVHMLSTHSFNALLKTLEEPPPHVKFLLATTDPQKIPPTILSRCLQFNLKRLPREQIVQHLTQVVEQENIGFEPQALYLLAQAADGSLRDALSLLDQAIAYGAGHLSQEEVNNMLGTLDQKVALELVQLLAAQEASGLLQRVNLLAEQNPDFVALLGEILSLLQRIALIQILPDTLEMTQPEDQILLQLSQQMSPEDVQLFYQIGLLGRRDLPLAPEPRGGFEMVMLRMLVFCPAQLGQQPLIQSAPSTQMISSVANQQAATTISKPIDEPVKPTVSNDEWGKVVQLPELSNTIKQLALQCVLKERQDNVWHLALTPKYKIFLTKERERELEKILQKHYGDSQKVHIQVEHPEAETPAAQQQRIQESRQLYAIQEVEQDSFVIYMKEHCEAKINVK